jgi:hypothetical protein
MLRNLPFKLALPLLVGLIAALLLAPTAGAQTSHACRPLGSRHLGKEYTYNIRVRGMRCGGGYQAIRDWRAYNNRTGKCEASPAINGKSSMTCELVDGFRCTAKPGHDPESQSVVCKTRQSAVSFNDVWVN